MYQENRRACETKRPPPEVGPTSVGGEVGSYWGVGPLENFAVGPDFPVGPRVQKEVEPRETARALPDVHHARLGRDLGKSRIGFHAVLADVQSAALLFGRDPNAECGL